MNTRLNKLLSAGDKLELSFEADEGSQLTLESSLKSLIDNNTLIIQTPAHHAHGSLCSDHTIRLVASKDSSGILEMNGRILQCKRTGDTSTLVVELIEDVCQTQRRQYFRLPILRDVQLAISGEGYLDGLTQNISAGGIRCILPMRPREGAKIKVKLDLNKESFELTGEILETMVFDEPSQRFIIRIRFIDPTEKDRSRLISYIFGEQSRQKRMSD